MNCLCLFILGVFLQMFESSEQTSDTTIDNIKHRKRRDTESSSASYFHYQGPQYPRDCKEVYEPCDEQTESGIFMIQPVGAPEPFKVFCNNSIDGGGWTVFQRRMDGAVEFYREWNDYKNGFGFLRREFWLGNDKLSYLTNQGGYELRVDLISRDGISSFAKYELFRISDENSKYRLTDIGTMLPESTAWDAMNYHRNMSFTTKDRDNDPYDSIDCALHRNGAWWYNGCAHSSLNSRYFGRYDSEKTIDWGVHSNIIYTEMKVRPLSNI